MHLKTELLIASLKKWTEMTQLIKTIYENEIKFNI